MKTTHLYLNVLLSVLISGCATYSDNGELVRHHFGYVKVITPAIHAPGAAVRSLEVETYGVWVNIDGRTDSKYTKGYGAGIGYQYDRRDFIPLDCRVVIRAKNKEDIKYILSQIKINGNMEKGICIIRDSEK